MDFSDERLITITTQELKSLLTKGLISREKHNELRSRRRRLQNRKYARKCAHKKQIEVSYLHMEIDKERAEISNLRKQQAHLTSVADRYDAQRRKLVKLADNASNGYRPILMIGTNGKQEEVYLIPSDKPLDSQVSEPHTSNSGAMKAHPSSASSSGTLRSVANTAHRSGRKINHRTLQKSTL